MRTWGAAVLRPYMKLVRGMYTAWSKDDSVFTFGAADDTDVWVDGGDGAVCGGVRVAGGV